MFGVALGLLKGFPIWLIPAALIVWWGWSGHREVRVLTKAWNAERVEIAAATARDAALHEAEQKRMLIEKEGIVNDLIIKAKDADGRAAAELALVIRMQHTIASLRKTNTVPGTTTPITAVEAADRFGTVATECAEQYRALVASARKGYIAGIGCEREYESLIPPQPAASSPQ